MAAVAGTGRDGRRYMHINTGPAPQGEAVADSREVVCVWREGAAIGRREWQAPCWRRVLCDSLAGGPLLPANV